MMGMGGMLVMWLFWILLIALVVWGIYKLVDRSGAASPGRDEATSRESPREILERRYAAGEISTEEYEERRHKLSK